MNASELSDVIGRRLVLLCNGYSCAGKLVTVDAEHVALEDGAIADSADGVYRQSGRTTVRLSDIKSFHE